jgi:hypothetical protein
MLLVFLTLLVALSISSVAAYFSIIGLSAIFAANYWPVIIMGIVLEAGKITAALWLHRHWREAPKLLRGYLMSAVAVLMLITSMGIFGFLSAGHLAQNVPAQAIELQLQHLDEQIAQDQKALDNNQTQLDQLNKTIDTFLNNNRATNGEAIREHQNAERRQIQRSNDEINKHMAQLQNQEADFKQKDLQATAKLGPIMYLAPLLGVKDVDGAVRFVIFMIMFAFDPIAIALAIAAQWSFLNRKKASAPIKASVNEPEVKIEMPTKQTEPNIVAPTPKIEPPQAQTKVESVIPPAPVTTTPVPPSKPAKKSKGTLSGF